MTAQSTPDQSPNEACANCGAPLSGDYCAACGQSREDIRRPALSLVTETLDGLLSWDGRLLTTFRQLFTRPGRVARDYADGRRQRYTPPVRLYLIVSLIFFALMTVSGVRIVAVNITIDGDGDPSVIVTLFQPPRTGAVETLSSEQQEQVLAFLSANGTEGRWTEIAVRAMNDPELLEDQTSAASSQAMILMVVVFTLLCAIFHPHRRMIEHAIYALYFHAALLLPLAAAIVLGIYASPPIWAALTLLGVSVLLLNAGVALFDRGFYASSWFGAILRSVVICMAYATSAVFVAMGLIYVAAV